MKLILAAMVAMFPLIGGLQAGRDLFVFDNGLTDIKSADEQAALLKEVGFDGICTRPDRATDEFLAAMKHHGIRVMATYVTLTVKGDGKSIPESIGEHLGKLKQEKPIVWLAIANPDAGDEATVATIREVCEVAAANGLEVVLYPHVGFKTHSPAECERLRKLADRPNLGLSFNLCHFLCQEGAEGLEATLRGIAPHLKIVQISGADVMPPGKPDWKRLIQPLGQGTFDMGRVMRILDEIGYQGPVNLQCYQIPPPARAHLTTSMHAWKKLN